MIPIKEAISSGAWLHCEYKDRQDLIQFRLRTLTFRKINLSEVDDPQNIKELDCNSNFWILEVEVINLTKELLGTTYSTCELTLIDKDGYTFNVTNDSHLRLNSKFAEKSRLKRLYGSSLIPKLKVIGSIAFQLPDDDEAEYSISIKDGVIREA